MDMVASPGLPAAVQSGINHSPQCAMAPSTTGTRTRGPTSEGARAAARGRNAPCPPRMRGRLSLRARGPGLGGVSGHGGGPGSAPAVCPGSLPPVCPGSPSRSSATLGPAPFPSASPVRAAPGRAGASGRGAYAVAWQPPPPRGGACTGHAPALGPPAGRPGGIGATGGDRAVPGGPVE